MKNIDWEDVLKIAMVCLVALAMVGMITQCHMKEIEAKVQVDQAAYAAGKCPK